MKNLNEDLEDIYLAEFRSTPQVKQVTKDYRLLSLLGLITLIPVVIFFLVLGHFLQQSYREYRFQQLSLASQLFNYQIQQSHLRSLGLLDLLVSMNQEPGEDVCECFLAQASDIEAWNQISARGVIDIPPEVQWVLGSPGQDLYGIYRVRSQPDQDLFLVQALDLSFWDELTLTLPVNAIIYYPITSQVLWSNLPRDRAQSILIDLRTPNQSQPPGTRDPNPIYLSNALVPSIGDPIQIVFFPASSQIDLVVLRITRVAFILILGLLVGVLGQMKLLDRLVFSKIRSITKILPTFEKYLDSKSVLAQDLSPLAGYDDIARLNQEFLAMTVRLEKRFQTQQAALDGLEKHQLEREQSHQAFLGFLGQEIRSPLHSMIGLANLLETNHLSQGSEEVVTILNQEIQRVSEVISLLLDLHSYQTTGGAHGYERFTLPDLFRFLKGQLSEEDGHLVNITNEIHPRLVFWGPKKIIHKVLARIIRVFLALPYVEELSLDCFLDSSKEPGSRMSQSVARSNHEVPGRFPIQFSIQGVFSEAISLEILNTEFLFIRYLLLPMGGEVGVQTSSHGLNQEKKKITLDLKLSFTLDEQEKKSTMAEMDLKPKTQQGEPRAQALPLMSYGKEFEALPLGVSKQVYTDLLSQDVAILSQALLILRVLSSDQEHVKLEQLVLLADAHLQTSGMNREFLRLRSLLVDHIQPIT